jgi:uncharacterized protein (DUF433 family)
VNEDSIFLSSQIKNIEAAMLAFRTIAAKVRNRDFTAAQVSAMLGMQSADVNNLIDEIAPTGMATVRVGRRTVQYKGLMPLLIAQDLIKWGLKPDLRRQALAKSIRTTGKNVSVPGTSLSLLVDGHRSMVAKSVRSLYEAEESVQSSPDIMRGEPCVKGTRVSAYWLAEIVEADGIAEAKRTYSQLTNRQIEHACLYAKANPRRGRPKEVRFPSKKAKTRKTVVVD